MPTASEIALGALKDALDGGRMFWFSGPVPANENVALDMDNLHTQLVAMTESGDGTTGLTFADPSGIAMTKDPDEVWSGLIEFDGAEDTETTLTATFYRFCAVGDDGRGVATLPRLQGTIGAPGSDIPLTNAALEANTLNTQGMSYFAVLETPMSSVP